MPGAADPEKINELLMGRGKLAFYIVDSDASSKLTSYLAQNPLGVDDKTLTVADSRPSSPRAS